MARSADGAPVSPGCPRVAGSAGASVAVPSTCHLPVANEFGREKPDSYEGGLQVMECLNNAPPGLDRISALLRISASLFALRSGVIASAGTSETTRETSELGRLNVYVVR